MNQKLQEAETKLLHLLSEESAALSMEDILTKIDDIDEAELRAAVWTLRSEGVVDFDDGRLKAVKEHVAV